MEKIGIITIHRIFNYGSVLQAFALQNVCESLGYEVEIIDYVFPNGSHNYLQSKKAIHKLSLEEKIAKYLYVIPLFRQHKKIKQFIKKYLNLSKNTYFLPEDLKLNPPKYDIYLTGSDQLWNPRYTYGDSVFFLDFVQDNKLKIAYASSFGVADIESKYRDNIKKYLLRYKSISVRETSGQDLIKKLTGQQSNVVLDPTLLLDANRWNNYIIEPRISEKYILCYFLNYTFDAFPYVDDLAEYLKEKTGYKLIKIARPPHDLKNRGDKFKISASPLEFLGWIKHAALVLTTSFHGTAFAVNFSVPVFSIIESRKSLDSRQLNLLESLGLENRILTIDDSFPEIDDISYDYSSAQSKLSELRESSISFLKQSLRNE